MSQAKRHARFHTGVEAASSDAIAARHAAAFAAAEEEEWREREVEEEGVETDAMSAPHVKREKN
jgi:hypothetical protein